MPTKKIKCTNCGHRYNLYYSLDKDSSFLSLGDFPCSKCKSTKKAEIRIVKSKPPEKKQAGLVSLGEMIDKK